MTVSRRKFLKTGTMVGLAAVIPMKSAFAQTEAGRQELFKIPDESQTDVLDRFLNEETFSMYVNTRFRFHTSPLTAINLELIKVSRPEALSKEMSSTEQSARQQSAKTPKLDCFSVVFRGPRNVVLKSRTYRVEHDQMGSFDLFITPVDDHKKQRRYQAVFNRVAN